ncbi:MAG: NAD-glutamate dehydrogenase domain-containing protein, partial [bacterium]
MKILYNMYATETTYELSVDENHNLVWAEIIVPGTEAGRIPNHRLDDFYKKNDIDIAYNVRYPINQIEVVLLGLRCKSRPPAELMSLLDANASDLFSTWASRFREAFFAKHPHGKKSKERLDRYLAGMSPEYELHQEPTEALYDLDVLDSLQDQNQYLVNYYHSSQDDLIKIYCRTPQKISDLVPIIKNFGFVVLRDHLFPYSQDGQKKYAYAFSVPAETSLTNEDRTRISDCIAAVLNGRLTSKPINAVVKVAGLSKRELDLAKALCAYFFKFNTSHAFTSIQNVLVRYPTFTKRLIGFFQTRFDPASQTNDIKRAKEAVLESFGELASVVDEAICKAFFNIVTAIVRTNYFLNRSEISFKIDSALVENMPLPIPLYEIYIYSHNMEGIHLRGGRIARGGIRWSDRPDDFRTEILGLMKAQMTKNTVIVPVGSKGGFVIKNLKPGSRDDFLKAGVETYKRFISSLLDLTDNLARNGSVVPAAGIRRYDGDDTYLVVAADKGTATFSDIANEISISRKFWLTDAFASGGSNGYDHKKQGITAKGAWESVKRHFHEIGIHPEKDEITAVGIGDMAGDVFGNGMLLSRTIRLVAAFNHLYIFLDPNPDPEASFAERQRLFEIAGNWDKYDRGLISAGGGLYDRKSRSIEISAEVRDGFGIKAKRLSGEALIKAILCAPVDLLWNGGIGTYVKASTETHFQTGDPANDRLRVNGKDIRARVVGEGGNLGFTQAARVEAAERGVRLNTDSIDNSAGVNMSDHEVNLKIFFDVLRRQKLISDMAERNVIIKRYEKDEIKLVLRQNYLNNLGLSLDARRLPSQFAYFRALIKFLNQQGLFDKAKDCIPFETDLDRIE